MKTAIYPGSFDPVTYGHLEIISRASKLFDKVIVLVSVNPLKPCSFTIEERKQFLRESVVAEGIGNVEVDSNEGLLIDYFNEHNADVIVKGLRAISDFEYEFQMAQVYLSVIQHGKADSDVRRRYKRFRSGVHTRQNKRKAEKILTNYIS